jgi:transcription initiation factor IIE alpha subunit
MTVCSAGHEAVVYDETKSVICPCCDTQGQLSDAIRRINQLENKISDLEEIVSQNESQN